MVSVTLARLSCDSLVITLGIAICFPIGVLSKKCFRRWFPSRPGLVNPSRYHSFIIVYSYLCASVIISSLLLRPFSHFRAVKGLAASLFLFGWRSSVLGLTGGIASGKSTVSKYLQSEARWRVIDADQIARDIVKKGEPAYNEVVCQFGSEVINKESGELDRRALGERIFSDPIERRKLERITHPRVLREMFKQVLLSAFSTQPVVMDVPLLFEPRKAPLLYLLCSETISIDLPREEQIKRLQERNPDLSFQEAYNRIASQVSREKRLRMADYVIENGGNIADLHQQINRFLASVD